MPSAELLDGNEVECITLSDNGSHASNETDDCLVGNSEVFQCTRTDNNAEDQISNEEACSLDNRGVTVNSLPAMPDSNEIASNTSETNSVQCNELPSDSKCTCIQL